MHFQGSGSREALIALWKGTDAGTLVGSTVTVLHHRLRLSLPSAAVVHEMCLQVPFTPKPDPACLTGKDVLWKDTEVDKKTSQKVFFPSVLGQF